MTKVKAKTGKMPLKNRIFSGFSKEIHFIFDEIFVWENADFSSAQAFLKSIWCFIKVKFALIFENSKLRLKSFDPRVTDPMKRKGNIAKTIFAYLTVITAVFVIFYLISSRRSVSEIIYSNLSMLSAIMISALFLVNRFFCPKDTKALIITTTTSLLVAIGYLLQQLYSQQKCTLNSNGQWLDSSLVISSMWVNSLLGLVLAAFFAFALFVVISLKKKRLGYFICLASVGVCFLLLVASGATNGAHLFITIFGFSLQLTEIIKVLDVFMLAMICSADEEHDHMTDWARFIYICISVVVNVVGFLACNEMGTLIVVGIATLVLSFLTISPKKLIAALVAGAVLFAAVFCVSTVAFNKLHPSVDRNTIDITKTEEYIEFTKDMSDEEKRSLSEEKKNAILENEAIKQENELSKAKSEKAGFLVNELSYFREKLEDRMGGKLTFLDKFSFLQIKTTEKEDIDELSQAGQLRKAIERIELFGTDTSMVLNGIPEANQELIFIYALMQLGSVTGAIIIICYIVLMITILISACRLPKKYALALIGIAILIVGQSFIEILVSIDVLGIIGIGAAYLSNGGSAMFVNYALTFFVFYALRNHFVCQKAPEKNNEVKESNTDENAEA